MAKATPVFINGKDYPVKYGMAALRAFSDATGITLGELGSIGNNMTITQALALVWAGLKDGARVTQKDFKTQKGDSLLIKIKEFPCFGTHEASSFLLVDSKPI